MFENDKTRITKIRQDGMKWKIRFCGEKETLPALEEYITKDGAEKK